jgi:CelD/BcsL family acetyltransferase involved in cellulose biosynthesis
MSAAPAISKVEAAPMLVKSASCSLRVYQDVHDLEQLRPDWDTLLAKYPLATTFSTWDWLSSWWNAYARERKLLAIALYNGANSLVGLGMFSLATEKLWGRVPLRVLRLLGDGTYDSDNLDLPVVPGFEDIFTRAIFEYLRNNKSQFDLCEWNTLPPDSLVGNRLSQLARPLGWSLAEISAASSAIPLPRDWENYLETLSSEDRKNIPRYTRRLESRYQVRIHRCEDVNRLPLYLNSLFQLHQGRWQSAGQPGTFAVPERRSFYQELSRHLSECGSLQLWTLELDGQIVAVQFAFRYGDRVFQLQEGYDHSRPSDRVGYVLRAHVLKALISEGVRVYDFMGGEDVYKARWGAQPGHYLNLRFALPYTRGGAALKLHENAKAGKHWLRRRLPAPAWELLRNLKAVLRPSRPSSEVTAQV